MIEVHSHTSRLASIEHALVAVYGMLGCMQADGSVPPTWQSQVEEKRILLGTAVLDVINERIERGCTYPLCGHDFPYQCKQPGQKNGERMNNEVEL